jgi:hypothetical protein
VTASTIVVAIIKTPAQIKNKVKKALNAFSRFEYSSDGGKEVWKSLKASHFSVAEAKLAEFLKEHRQRVRNGNGEVSAKIAFGEAAAIHLRNLDDDMSIKPRTRQYWRQRLAALIKSWPGLNEREVRKITQADCKKWASTYGKTVSPTNLNNTSRCFGTF